MPVVVIPKKIAKRGQRMTFLSIKASGIERVTIAVIKAKTVPKGAPLPTKASIIGRTLTELAYNGTPKRTAKGTVQNDFADR